MKLTGKITKTISAAVIFAMFTVPVLASSALQGGFLTDTVLGNGTNDIVLLARGGNGNGNGGNGSGNGSGDRDGSGSGDLNRDRHASCQVS